MKVGILSCLTLLMSEAYGTGFNTGAFWKRNSNPGSWIPLSITSAPSARTGHAVVWTGSEMIVWGGFSGGAYLSEGSVYNPISDSWTAMSLTDAPAARKGATAIWDGNQFVIWGGYNGTRLNTGGAYTRATNTWLASTNLNLVPERTLHTAVWTGSEMIIWGGFVGGYVSATGNRFDPATDSWTTTAVDSNTPSPRNDHTAVWDGSAMIVWGGDEGSGVFANTGGRYTPGTNSWTKTSTTSDTPIARGRHVAVWNGSNEMLIWGGLGNGSSSAYLNTGGRYNPTTNTWSPMNLLTLVPERSYHSAVWTGSVMLTFGGYNGSNYLTAPTQYNPTTDTWSVLPTSGAPSARAHHSAVWTGTDMIIWGGYDGTYLTDGKKFTPGSPGTWSNLVAGSEPSGRRFHTTVWTGTDMIVWGGETAASTYTNTGGKYNPTTGWTATDVADVDTPSARYGHTAIWQTATNEMIVWGGADSSNEVNDGGHFNPSTNSWVKTGTLNVPSHRKNHSAVWTGTEMIIWGGTDGNSLSTGGRYTPGTKTWGESILTLVAERYNHTAVWSTSTNEMLIYGGENGTLLNTGRKYNPTTDSWVAMATSPLSVREEFSAVWTGTEMWIWGGFGNGTHLNDGAKYNPGSAGAAGSWTTITTTNAPSHRRLHSAVWTGSEMIVWGGVNASGTQGDGKKYDGTTWTAISSTNAPSLRYDHTAVWTGTLMIVWGGYYSGSTLNTGGIYRVSDDTWLTGTNIDSSGLNGRRYHSAVWSGTEMIIWGGNPSGSTAYNDGSRFNPTANGGLGSWTAVTTTGAPAGRYHHKAVWTSGLATPVMTIWGGYPTTSSGSRYNPATDTWSATTTTGVPTSRYRHSMVWASSLGTPVAIVWGGLSSGYVNTGGRYNPSTNAWTATALPTTLSSPAPAVRYSHAAIWSGNRMVIWGGRNSSSSISTGSRYDPTGDTWAATTSTTAPVSRVNFSFVWTGTRMIVYGGDNTADRYHNTGGAYDPNPAGDDWDATRTGDANNPPGRYGATAVWTGTEMWMWGGQTSTALNTGGKYNLASDTWTTITTTGAPSARHDHTAVYTGTEMIIWGGNNAGTDTNTGGKYNGTSWTATDSTDPQLPMARSGHTAVWTGTEMIIWGGFMWDGSDFSDFASGARYTPGAAAGTGWVSVTTTNEPAARSGHTAIWNSGSSEMIVWGGTVSDGMTNTGGRYNTTSGWTRTSTGNAANAPYIPMERDEHTAVYDSTNGDMIIWGGFSGTSVLDTGAKYDTSTDAWVATTSTGANVPSARFEHTAVWTGTEMIIWGGRNISAFNSGAKYNATGNSWTSMATGPVARANHTAVWSGSQMIIWGGVDGSYLTSGSRYTPGSNTWSATASLNAPAARVDHTAVWAGNGMIIWGGYNGTYMNSGAKYNPVSDYWVSTSTGTNVPTARTQHSAVWTGTKMLIWGGTDGVELGTGAAYTP